jgi:hypothetical protein
MFHGSPLWDFRSVAEHQRNWRFLVVKDPEIKKKVQVSYMRLYDETVGPRYASSAPPPGSDPARYQRLSPRRRPPPQP